MAISFIGGGDRNTQRKPKTFNKGRYVQKNIQYIFSM